MKARRIPADVVVAKLPFGFMAAFLSTCMSMERGRIRHFPELFYEWLLNLTRDQVREFL
jgi:hypothetical protein